MAYTTEDLAYFHLPDTQESRQKIVTLDLFLNIDKINLATRTQKLNDETLFLYDDYLQEILTFEHVEKLQILETLMNTEVINNHVVERENINLLKKYNETHHSTAINYLLQRLVREQKKLDTNIINEAHKRLMMGTSNGNKIFKKVRNNNKTFVGYKEQEEIVVNYLPISYDEIAKSLELLCSYYNDKCSQPTMSLIKPIIVHGLIATLQMFEDGNTRFARCMQHVNLFTNTNNLLNISLELPSLYCSKTYIPYRRQYRELIMKLALDPSFEAWDDWINFNLRRVQDQLYANQEKLIRLKK